MYGWIPITHPTSLIVKNYLFIATMLRYWSTYDAQLLILLILLAFICFRLHINSCFVFISFFNYVFMPTQSRVLFLYDMVFYCWYLSLSPEWKRFDPYKSSMLYYIYSFINSQLLLSIAASFQRFSAPMPHIMILVSHYSSKEKIILVIVPLSAHHHSETFLFFH